jgi:hypothetical protein
MEKCLSVLNKNKLVRFEILNNSMDVKFFFENRITLTLFNSNGKDKEQRALFTPDKNVLVIGPGNAIVYKLESSYEWL